MLTSEGPVHIAIIGGTGLSSLPHFTPIAQLPLHHHALRTPWGPPSSPITILSHPRHIPVNPLSTTSTHPSSSAVRSAAPPLNVAFISRHGLHHEYAPHEVPYRANIAALRKLGVCCVLAFSAVGSLKESVRPRDFLIPDQAIDRTKGVRPFTFFEDGIVSHVPFADPFDPELRQVILKAIADHSDVMQAAPSAAPSTAASAPIADPTSTTAPPKVHPDGLLVCMEGPQFSTRAESNLYRTWGASVINMSCLPEAKLAREAEMAYAMICMSTDYDCWREEEGGGGDVSVEMVMANMAANAGNARRVCEVVLDVLGREEDAKDADAEKVRRVVQGERWKGLGLAGISGMTADYDKRRQMRDRMQWLFEGFQVPDLEPVPPAS